MRYSRQIPIVGEEGQRRLAGARVFVAGAGGLGSNLILHLTSAGLGHIVVADHDVVTESDLNRTPFRLSDLGVPKVEALARLVGERNPEVELEPLRMGVEEVDIGGFDLIFDCLDNVESRLNLESSVADAGLGVVHGGIEGLRGQVAHYHPSSYRLIRELFTSRSRAWNPVLGPTAMLAASLMALEGILHISRGRGPLLGKMLIFDLETLSFGEVDLPEPEH